MNCRHCGEPLRHRFLDLGHAPPSNAYLETTQLDAPEITFPLRLFVCDRCWLVQTEDYAHVADLFNPNYAYFSSTSRTWLDHARKYFDMARKRFKLDRHSFVIEVASNDGYLLRNFVRAGIPCLGVEPTTGTAAAARARGIPVREEFFDRELGTRLANEGLVADLVIGNNVLAHVPDINSFAAGLEAVLRQGGTITLEFPHLMRMIEGAQFDTAYHEHFSYLSLYTVVEILANVRLRVFDVEELPTHGGSLRVYGCRASDPRVTTPAVTALLAAEERMGLRNLTAYSDFQARADRIKDDLVAFLIAEKRAGRRVGAYGAAAKGNTLLNYAGIKPDLLPYVCDLAPSKQGRFLPGSHIPIVAPSVLRERRPDTVLILPCNISHEIADQLMDTGSGDARLVVAVPRLSTVTTTSRTGAYA